MIKKMKKGIALVAVLAMTAGCFAGCGTEIDSTEIVATEDGTEIPMGVAAMYTRYQQASMYYMYGTYYGMTEIFDSIADAETYDTYGEVMKDSIFESLTDMYILRNHADEYGVALTEEETAAAAEAAQAFIEANGEEVLKAIGTSEETLTELFELYKYQSKMQDAMVADVDQEVSDEEAKQSRLTYVRFALTDTDEDGNTVELTEEQMEAQNDRAEAVLALMLEQEDIAGADMEAVAQEVHEDLTAVSYTYDDESTYIDSEILAAVEGLKDGEMVDKVVMSSDGTELYVVRFDADLDRDATDTEKENIIGQREQEDYQAELDTWTEAAEIKVNDKVWDKISLNDSQVFTFAEEEVEEETTEETATEEVAE